MGTTVEPVRSIRRIAGQQSALLFLANLDARAIILYPMSDEARLFICFGGVILSSTSRAF
jgi:hypothetical protein